MAEAELETPVAMNSKQAGIEVMSMRKEAWEDFLLVETNEGEAREKLGAGAVLELQVS